MSAPVKNIVLNNFDCEWTLLIGNYWLNLRKRRSLSSSGDLSWIIPDFIFRNISLFTVFQHLLRITLLLLMRCINLIFIIPIATACPFAVTL